MPQMHLYLSKEIATKVKKKAAKLGISSSKYMANILKKELSSDWPEGYFESFFIDDPSFQVHDDDLLPPKEIEL